MGKTLGTILAIGAAIAVNVIPGVGQFLSAAIGSTLATAVISSITLYGLQAGVSLISGGSSAKPDTTETAIKTSRPPRVSAYGTSRLYGAYILYETASNGTAVDAYAVHDGKLDGVVARYVGDDIVTLTGTAVNQGDDKRYKGGALNYYSTDGSVPGAGIPAITALVPSWAGRGDGVVLLGVTAKSVKAKDFQETYPSSAVPVPSLVARWQRCPDPAAVDPLDEAAWTWTENPVRQLLHYKLVRAGPKPALPRSNAGYAAALATIRAAWWARKIAPTLQYWIDAAADCDSARALKAGGTEPRYRSAVAHKHTDEHKGPVSALLATFDGWLAPRADGALIVYSGRIYEVDEADLIGTDEIVSYTWEGGGVDDGEAVNEVICNYISAAHDYNSVECDSWRDEADITRRGQVLSSPLDVQVPSHAQVRYLAKRLIARKNSPFRGTITTNIAGRKAQGKRFIPVHIEEAGTVFYSGPAEIIALSRNIRGGVTFQWVAVDPNVDNWNPATEEGDPAALGTRVASEPLDTPTIDEAEAVSDADGVRLALEVGGPNRDDLIWYVHWRLVGAAVWGPDEEYSDTDPGATVLLRTGLVPADADIEVEVAYQIGDGRYSSWSVAEVVDTASSNLPPPAPTITGVAGTAGQAAVTFRYPSRAFEYVRLYRNTVDDLNTATLVGGNRVAGLGAVETVNDAQRSGLYFYWAVAYNGGGTLQAASDSSPAYIPYSAGTNLVAAPADFTAGSWTKDNAGAGSTNPVVTANYANAPDGTLTADRLQFARGAGGGTFSRIQTAAGPTVNGTSYRAGVWLKAPVAGYSVCLRLDGNNGPALQLTTDWRYYTLTAAATGATVAVQLLIFSSVTNSPVAADVTAWGAELLPS